jgi:septin family protein
MMAANLLDQYRVAMLYNRATNEDMANGMREFAKEKKEAEKQQVTQQQEQQQQMMQEQQQMMQQQSDENQKNRDDAMLGKQLDHQNKLESDMIKSYGKKNNDNQTVI